MFELYKTPADILYLISSISIALVALFLVIALWNLICILRNARKVSEKAKDTIDLVNHYLWQPIKIMLMIIERLKDVQFATKAKRHSK
jgi:ABC-type multidrug transport system fused ATPase/permease subunit